MNPVKAPESNMQKGMRVEVSLGRPIYLKCQTRRPAFGFASCLHPGAIAKLERPDEKAKMSIPKPPTPWKHKKGTLGHVLRKSEMRNRESYEGSQRKHH